MQHLVSSAPFSNERRTPFLIKAQETDITKCKNFLLILCNCTYSVFMEAISNPTTVMENEETIAISNIADDEPMEVSNVATAATGYTVFIPNFTEPCTLISSTGDRYNDTIRNSLTKDIDIIQQSVNLEQQSTNNNFYRNAKWYERFVFIKIFKT